MNPTAIHDYIKAGLFLVPIPPVNHKPVKGPTRTEWNLPKSPDNPNGYSNDPEDIIRRTKAPGSNIGLALEPSKVASIDLDDLGMAGEVLALADIDIDALLAAPNAVRIIGREGRGKLLYRVPEGFECCSTKLVFGKKGKDERAIFELRYKGSNGHTGQDVLPPSIHPDTGKPYELVGDITKIPPLPQALADLWKQWQEWLPVLRSLDPHYAEVINKAKKIKPKAGAPRVEGAIDPIRLFNERHSIHEVLTSHGYKQKGKRLSGTRRSRGTMNEYGGKQMDLPRPMKKSRRLRVMPMTPTPRGRGRKGQKLSTRRKPSKIPVISAAKAAWWCGAWPR